MNNVFELLKMIYQITYAIIYINKDGSSTMSSKILHIFPRTSEHVCSSFPVAQQINQLQWRIQNAKKAFSRDLTIPHLDLSHFALCIMGN